MRATASSLWVVAVLCAVGRASAAVPAATLSVERSTGAEQCPDTAELAARVARLRTRRELVPGARGQGPVHFDVQLQRTDQGWLALLKASGERHGERQLTDNGQSCDGLGAAVALTLAMLVDGEGDIGRTRPGPPSKPVANPAPRPRRAAPPPLPVRSPAPAVRVAPRAKKRLHQKAARTQGASVAANAVASFGVLARLAPGASAQADLDIEPGLHLGLGGLWMPTQSFDHGPGHVDVSLWAAELHACRDLLGDSRSMALGACIRAAAGALAGSGHGYAAYTTSARRLWAAVGAGPELDGALAGPLGWTAGLELWVPLIHQRFAVHGVSGFAFDPPPAAACAKLGLRLRIW